MKSAFIGLLLLATIGCTTPVYVAHYDLDLSSVTRANRRFSDVRGHTFEDELIKTTWNPFEKQLGLIVTNRTDHPVRVLWNDVRYVDVTGKSERVVHEASSPAEIEPRKTLLELIEPVGRRPDAPLIAYTYGYSERDVRSKMTRGTITVLLPIEADGVVHEYSFRFAVTGTVAQRGWSS